MRAQRNCSTREQGARLAISPDHVQADFPRPATIDDRIDVFCSRTRGWQLGIADQIINGKKSRSGKCIRKPIKDSGFATLHVVFSYFEMIAKYQAGYAGNGESPRYFREGVKSVFPQFCKRWADRIEPALDILYKAGRCGLYHDGIASRAIIISGCTSHPICPGLDENHNLVDLLPINSTTWSVSIL